MEFDMLLISSWMQFWQNEQKQEISQGAKIIFLLQRMDHIKIIIKKRYQIFIA
jgi:hypothetical protein